MVRPEQWEQHPSNLLFANWPFQPGKAQPAEHHMRIEDIMRNSGITTDPVLSYQGNGVIHDLVSLHHRSWELEYLQDKTVQVYLFEPMCCYLLDDPDQLYPSMPFNSGFYSEFNPGTEAQHRCVELDTIQKYAQQNNIRVTVRTGDYEVEQYSDAYPELTLVCDDVFLKTMVVFEDTQQLNKRLQKRFISTNWRYTPARAAVSALLCELDCDLVWSYQVDPQVVLNSVWLKHANSQLKQKITQGLEYLNSSVPRYLDIPTKVSVIEENNCSSYPDSDIDVFNPVGINNNHCPLKPHYERSFLDVVCESRFAQPTANISEKVMQSIQYMTPFIMVAPPHTLQYLHSLGFETFSKWWDESYDNELDHAVRLEKITLVIQQISDMSLNEINNMYADMQSLLKRNLDLYITKHTLPGELQVRNPVQEELVQWTQE
jgi:hypothetical protein